MFLSHLESLPESLVVSDGIFSQTVVALLVLCVAPLRDYAVILAPCLVSRKRSSRQSSAQSDDLLDD